MATWVPLRNFLAGVDGSVTLEWAELDEMVGGLPASAERHREFWAGDRSGWPGFRTKDVQIGKRVTFERVLVPTSATSSTSRGEGKPRGVAAIGADVPGLVA